MQLDYQGAAEPILPLLVEAEPLESVVAQDTPQPAPFFCAVMAVHLMIEILTL